MRPWERLGSLERKRKLETASTASTLQKMPRTTVSSGNTDGEDAMYSSSESLNELLSGRVDVNGFLVHPSEKENLMLIFERHPDFASEVQVKSKKLRTTCINIILDLIETVCLPLEELSDELINESSAVLADVVYAGFKLDWLDEKLQQLLQKKKMVESSGSKLQEMEKELARVEVEKVKLDKKCSYLKQEVEKFEAVVAAAKISHTFDDIV